MHLNLICVLEAQDLCTNYLVSTLLFRTIKGFICFPDQGRF